MMTDTMPPISIASADLRRLKQVAVRALQDRHPVGRFLFSELERANACAPEASDRCVRLDEWVTFRADQDGAPESRMLVLPDNFRSSTVHLSVLSPLGAALLGLQAGARMPYVGIDGVPHLAVVESLDPPDGVVSLRQWRSTKSSVHIDDNPNGPGPTAA
jgi:regulator of nucleoside diphosphate kinase